jgi:hypothetical protein
MCGMIVHISRGDPLFTTHKNAFECDDIRTVRGFILDVRRERRGEDRPARLPPECTEGSNISCRARFVTVYRVQALKAIEGCR